MKAIQLYYPPEWAHCYGCGYLNAHGLHIQTYWDPEKGESETRFTPRPYHTAIPGFVYGGLLASLVDCHSTATAAAAKAQAEEVLQRVAAAPACGAQANDSRNARQSGRTGIT